MELQTHGDRKYPGSQLLGGQPMGRAARRAPAGPAGAQNPLTSTCTELVFILSGQAKVRRTGDGQKQEGLALPGTSWLVPAGTHETHSNSMAPWNASSLSAREVARAERARRLGLDPDRTQLAYAGGVADPVWRRSAAPCTACCIALEAQ